MGKIPVVALLALLMAAPAATALENEDLLAMVAMPLAVAAVSEVADVPMNELIDVVTLLNDAAVPPPQFVEVVRYVPVALVVEDDQPDFVEFVRVREREGLFGLALVNAIEDQFRVYDLPDVDFDIVTAPRIVEVLDRYDRDYDDRVAIFVPPIVRTRVAEVRSHPHGGPPGQLKKQEGLQTGAEIVHGTRRGRGARSDDRDDDRAVSRAARTETRKVKRNDDDKPRKVARAARSVDRVQRVSTPQRRNVERPQKVRGGGEGRGKSGGNRGNGGGGGKGNGKGKGKG